MDSQLQLLRMLKEEMILIHHIVTMLKMKELVT